MSDPQVIIVGGGPAGLILALLLSRSGAASGPPDGLPPRIIDDYGTIPGELTQTNGGKIGGIETERLELKVADPASNYDITEQILYLSKETDWPIRQIMYSGSQLVLDELVNDLKTNVGLTPSDSRF